MDKNSLTYWKIIRGHIDSAEQLEHEIHDEQPDVETADYIRDIFEVHILSNELSGIHRFDSAEAFQKIIHKGKEIEQRQPLFRKLIQMRLVAASIVLLIGLTALNFILFRPAHYSNDSDQPRSVVLSDFSEVVLAPRSELEVDRYYGLFNRELQLSGSAFFNVSTMPAKVFKVNTSYGEITVLGTRFFVLENLDQKSLQVELKEGRLSIMAAGQEKELLTDSGLATVTHDRIRITPGNEKMEYSWIGEPMVFEDVTVQRIIEQINLRYGFELIGLKEGQGADCKMHTVVYPGMVEDFIKELQILFDIKLRMYKGTFEINEVNCNG